MRKYGLLGLFAVVAIVTLFVMIKVMPEKKQEVVKDVPKEDGIVLVSPANPLLCFGKTPIGGGGGVEVWYVGMELPSLEHIRVPMDELVEVLNLKTGLEITAKKKGKIMLFIEPGYEITEISHLKLGESPYKDLTLPEGKEVDKKSLKTEAMKGKAKGTIVYQAEFTEPGRLRVILKKK